MGIKYKLSKNEVKILFIISLLYLILIYLSWPFITDDAYITFRYGRNLATGNGITFNPQTERVEGYSNLSFVLLSSILIKFRINPLIIIRIISVVSGILCIFLIYIFSTYLKISKPLSYFASLLFSLSSGFAYWTVSGLETAFYTLILNSAILLFIINEQEVNLFSIFLFIIASITRPEAPIFFMLLMTFKIYNNYKNNLNIKFISGNNLRACIIFFLFYFSYLIFKFFYFGTILPNSVLYKSIFPLSSGNMSIFNFFQDGTSKIGILTIDFIKSWLPFIILSLISLFSSKRKTKTLILLVFVSMIIFSISKPSVSHFNRFFLPITLCLIIVTVSGLEILFKKNRLYCTIIASLFLCLLFLWQIFNPYVNPKIISDRAINYKYGKSCTRKQLGEYFQKKYNAKGSIVIGDVGLVGYIFKGTIWDSLGLNDYNYTLKFKKDTKKYANYLFSKNPDAIVLSVRNQNNEYFPISPIEIIIKKNAKFKSKYKKTLLVENSHYNYHYEVYERQE